MSRATRTLVALALACVSPSPAAAQEGAERLLREGRVASAEALLYAAARRRPRDPDVRLALGRLVAARGAARVGAVLLEEARRFGAPPTDVARELAPLLARIGAWRQLAVLPGAQLGEAERARLAWLVSRDTLPGGGADTVAVALRAARTPGSLGAIALTVGGRELVADVDPSRAGLAIDRSLAREPWVRRFAAANDTASAVEDARVGALRLGDLPVRVEALGGRRASIGLDVLARLAPRADPVTGRLSLRRATRAPRAEGEALPLLVDASGAARVARGGRLVPLAELAPELARRGWRLDPRRGEIVLGR